MPDYLARTEDGDLEKTGLVSGGYNAVNTGAVSSAYTAYTYLRVGQANNSTYYFIWRAYLSFDTASLPAGATSATLTYALSNDFSTTDFDIRLYYKAQPTWGGTLTTADWGSGTTGPMTVRNTGGVATNTWYTVDIPVASLNAGGITEFELRGSREGTAPSGDEYVAIHSATSASYKPYLTVTLPSGENQDDQDGACVVLIYV